MPWFQATLSASVGGVFDYKAKGENLVESVGCRLSWLRDKLGPPVSLEAINALRLAGVFDYKAKGENLVESVWLRVLL